MNKKNIVQLSLNMICLVIVLVGSFIYKSNVILNTVIILIIILSIFIQVIAILHDQSSKEEE